jgi:hypothetical protein
MKLLAIALVFLLPVHVAAAESPPSDPVTSEPVVTDNPFLPENEDLGNCLSALPQPDCGSENRGGPIQWAVFGFVVAGLVFIGWRITRAVRARDRAPAANP